MKMIVLGMMSGTSADGIDVVIAEFTQASPALDWRIIKHHHTEFAPELRAEILACVRPESGTVDRLCALNFRLGEAFARAALDAIHAAGMSPDQVDLIGSHGQTLWHIPTGPDASTLQLGEAAVIAERTGITTISNFRTRDMAAGGQGAPLVPYLDVLLFTHPTLTRAAQNIGGIGNVTYIPPCRNKKPILQSPNHRITESPNPPTTQPFAFDTGPGNMLIDYAAQRITDGAWSFDRDGALAAQGRVDDVLLRELLQEPYLHARPPKTTGRELFGAQFGARVWERAHARGLDDYDIIATLTAFTAHSIAQAYRDFLPAFPDQVIVSGGGARNPILMRMLRDLLAPARVTPIDEFGIASEAKEALAFAVLAYETWHARPGNLPAATGARHPVVLGNITPGRTTNDEGRKIFDFRLAIGDSNLQSAIGNRQSVNDTAWLTEATNARTHDIDTLPTLEMVRRINAEDHRVAPAVAAELPAIARAIDAIAERMQRGGRLIYIGAGTSGRLGALDAAECPPTFSTSPDQVIALIAGGERALTHAIEGAEDDADAGARDIAAHDVSARDSVVGITASGRTPYVLGGLREAKRRGAFVVGVACNRPSPLEEIADVSIAPLVGPEVIAGSTRLKAGTAEKMVLNMLSTGTMIRLGKTFGNLMVDVQATNAKLRERARRIVARACDISDAVADELLARCNGEVKTAIVVARAGISPAEARQRLRAANGAVRAALEG
jgi:N-acetylmuramic acid 6-phosphate etherase